jgi:hypothetical protein
MKRKGDILIVFSLYKLLKFTYIKSVNLYFHGWLLKSREIISINKSKIYWLILLVFGYSSVSESS